MLVAFAFGSSDRSGTKRRVHGLADAMPHEAGRAIAAKVQLARCSCLTDIRLMLAAKV
jgi:hypothetical protein